MGIPCSKNLSVKNGVFVQKLGVNIIKNVRDHKTKIRNKRCDCMSIIYDASRVTSMKG